MSAQKQEARVTTAHIRARKGSEPIVSLTAYDACTALLVDRHVDFILVGDSLGMVIHGFGTTLPVSVDLMIAHARAVVGSTSRALVVVDLPFGSYEKSPADAFDTAAHILKETGAGAVKLEGGTHMAETVRFLVDRGIPVMGHVGLTPQAINGLGSFSARGRSEAEASRILADASAVAEAGAFAIVLEAVVEPLAREITEKINIPTIGIGGSSACDGQVLVLQDMLGFHDRVPKFVKKYANLAAEIEKAVETYAVEVRTRAFPDTAHTYAVRRG